MKTVLQNTTIPNSFSPEVKNYGIQWNPALTTMFYEMMFSGIGHFLQMKRNSETKQKVALQVDDMKGNFIMGAIVEYIPNEEGDMYDEGNWSLSMSFDPESINDAQVYHTSDIEYQRVLAERGNYLHNVQMTNNNFINPLVVIGATLLKNWLDLAAKEGEEVEIELPKYFTAKVIVENGEKIETIEPSGEMSQLIKNDISTQI